MSDVLESAIFEVFQFFAPSFQQVVRYEIADAFDWQPRRYRCQEVKNHVGRSASSQVQVFTSITKRPPHLQAERFVALWQRQKDRMHRRLPLMVVENGPSHDLHTRWRETVTVLSTDSESNSQGVICLPSSVILQGTNRFNELDARSRVLTVDEDWQSTQGDLNGEDYGQGVRRWF